MGDDRITTSLDEAVDEMLRKVAQAPGQLAVSDLANLRQLLGFGAVTPQDFYDLLIRTVGLLPSKEAAHARLLLRIDNYDLNLTKRRGIATEKYRVSAEGSARVWTERYVLAQVIHGMTAGVPSSARRGQGYEVEAARFRYWFEDEDPDKLRVDAELDLLILRDGVRIFTYGTDPTGGVIGDIECLSEDIGHRLLRKVPIRATAPNGELYTFFYLGGDMDAGDRSTIAVREFWDYSKHPAVREQGASPVSGGGPLSITLDASRAVVSHYATFGEPYERTRRPAPQKLIARQDDSALLIEIDAPTVGYIYGFWYKVVKPAND